MRWEDDYERWEGIYFEEGGCGLFQETEEIHRKSVNKAANQSEIRNKNYLIISGQQPKE
jgi:hypothetical protein